MVNTLVFILVPSVTGIVGHFIMGYICLNNQPKLRTIAPISISYKVFLLQLR